MILWNWHPLISGLYVSTEIWNTATEYNKFQAIKSIKEHAMCEMGGGGTKQSGSAWQGEVETSALATPLGDAPEGSEVSEL